MALTLAQVRTDPQNLEFARLLDELESWDRRMCREIDIDIEALLDLHYRRPIPELVAEMSPPDGRLFLAADGDRQLGCGGVRELETGITELARVYVRPDARGRGVGRALVEALIAESRAMGAAAIRLETASFMAGAQALYRSVGFERVAPYREVPQELEGTEVFMALHLVKPTA
jgi:ribosomal protein S18 acetylase RimI-like enzyme